MATSRVESLKGIAQFRGIRDPQELLRIAGGNFTLAEAQEALNLVQPTTTQVAPTTTSVNTLSGVTAPLGSVERTNQLLQATGAQPLSSADVTSPQTTNQNQNLPSEYQNILSVLEGYVSELQKRGQVINPNIPITPEKIAEFMSQASREIDPYYGTQLKLAKDTLLKEFGYSTQDILEQERQAEVQYGRNLRTLGEGAAEQGFALSGLRQRGERELAEDTQAKIATGRRQLQAGAERTLGRFGQLFGGANLPQLGLAEAPRVLPGEQAFARTGRELPFYQLSPEVYQGLVGSEQFAQEAAKRSRASELESGFRSQEALRNLRQISL